MPRFQPVGSALPPRRNDLVVAAARSAPVGEFIQTKAQDRALETFARVVGPQEAEATLQNAIAGDLRFQDLLFQSMMDSWPELQANINKLANKVANQDWETKPFAERGEDPDDASQKLAQEVERLLWRWNPDPTQGEHDFEDTIRDLAIGYFAGHYVSEILWDQVDHGAWGPRGTKVTPARFYGYPYQGEDIFQMDPTGEGSFNAFIPFPEHRFLIGIHKGHRGHATQAAPFRALVGYWMAATFGLKWFMRFAQLFGVPYRWGTADSSEDIIAGGRMMEDMGNQAWGMFKTGTEINFEKESAAGINLPQNVLIQMANDACAKFILGQTLTTSTPTNGGSKAQGEVHQDSEDANVDAVADFVGKTISRQLIPSILFWNYGSVPPNAPEFWAKPEEQQESALDKATRDKALGVGTASLPVSKQWYYDRHTIPVPAKGDDVLATKPPAPPVSADPNAEPDPNEEKPKPGEKVKAADAGLTWNDYPASSGSLGIPRAEMPQIHASNRGAMVGFLKARGVESRSETVPAASLKPTQAEYSPEKVKAAEDYTGGNRSILVSQDNHVVDGHHQWMAAAKNGGDIKVIRLMAPISRVLMMAHRMPSTTVAAADDSAPTPSAVDALMDNVLHNLTGVRKAWLSPVAPSFMRLGALAMSHTVTDQDFVDTLEAAVRALPELFGRLNADALQTALEKGMGSAVVSGSIERYTK